MSNEKPLMKQEPDLSVLKILVECFVDSTWDGTKKAAYLIELTEAIGLAAIEAFYGEDISQKLTVRQMQHVNRMLEDVYE